MERPKRWPIECPCCENRGEIVLDDYTVLACPLCNSWCAFCLKAPSSPAGERPGRGVLVAGARPAPEGELLFEGYVCDFHKGRLRSYSFITPPMVGRFAPGTAYLSTQWGRVFVELYGHGEAANWQELEDEARQPLRCSAARPTVRAATPARRTWLLGQCDVDSSSQLRPRQTAAWPVK